MLKIGIALILTMLVNGCTSVTRMGENDEIIVKTFTGLFSPSITQIEDTRNNTVLNYPGTSAIGQLAGPAAIFGGMYTFGSTSNIGRTNNTTNVNGGGSSVTGTVNPAITNTSSSGATSSSSANAQVTQ